jgi:hypothetical protein
MSFISEEAMSSGNVLEIAKDLVLKVGWWLTQGKRDPQVVADWLQPLINEEDPRHFLNRPAQASVDITSEGDWVAEWGQFYREVFGLQVDLSQVEIKDDPGGFGWIVIVVKELTLNRAWAKCRDRFPCSSYYGDDLSVRIDVGKSVAESYSRRFLNRVEADEENQNLSANVLKEQGVQEITLLERLLLELWYHWKTGGGHLDLLTVTLCSGSRDRYGSVPRANWDGNRLYVSCYHPSRSRSYLRTRSAV